MQKDTGKKQKRKQADGQLYIAGQQHKYCLNFTMQKPLEKYQRQKHQHKPDEA
ncbi:MAG: hypothetical protein IPO22_00965 [Anaerolineales bacterium]|nr:hypothetical protein [Anaerolineales bacterium]